jgi:NAD+ diphosphatase
MAFPRHSHHSAHQEGQSGSSRSCSQLQGHSLVAGFVETGESLEEAVHREVMEETGLTIKNVKYFSSQPWPYPSGLMVGYTAEYVDGEIHLQKEELSRGKWFSKDNLPILPEKLSIARRLIDAWLEGKI